MSSAASQYYFRRRNIGRAASPPTWACYEQIHDDDDYSESGSESCSEDDEDYTRAHEAGDSNSDSEDGEHVVDMCQRDVGGHDVDNMDMDIDGVGAVDEGTEKPVDSQSSKDIKGKQRAIEPEPEAESPKRRHRRRQRQHMYALRPILTIQRSQGFVWNQDLFVPPYIKDRYLASTSPPNASGFIPGSVGSNHSALDNYEVEVVEIRVQEGELDHIIP